MEKPPVRVAITAAGAVSPLGSGLDENAAALREGRDCVTPVTAFDVSKTRCKTAGQVTELPIADCQLPIERRLHRASRMMIAAMREVVARDAAFAPELLVIGTTGGGMSFGEEFHREMLGGRRTRRRAAWLANYMPPKMVLDAMEAAGFSAPMQIIANACASGTNAVGHAFSLVRGGLHRRVLVSLTGLNQQSVAALLSLD